MTGPIESRHDVLFNPDAFRHQLLLLKSLHCARPVLHEGRMQFIQCLSVNLSGCDFQMTVYLAGKQAGVDSSAVQIPADEPREEETHAEQ